MCHQSSEINNDKYYSTSREASKGGEGKVHTVHVIVLEDKKAQSRKALKKIYHIISQPHYPGGIQWRTIDNMVARDFTVTAQSSIVVDLIKHKKAHFYKIYVQ